VILDKTFDIKSSKLEKEEKKMEEEDIVLFE
jgi:hypothetical protein